MNKETLVFLLTLLLCGSLLTMGMLSGWKAPDIPRTKFGKTAKVDPPIPKKSFFLAEDEGLWDLESRDIFAEPRDIEDLPPLEILAPEPLPLDLIRVPPYPAPLPVLWSRLRQGFITDEDAGAATADLTVDVSSGSVSLLPEEEHDPTSDLAKKRAKLAREFDRISKDGRLTYGRIRNKDPRSLIDGEADRQENRYLLKQGLKLDFVQYNTRSGRPMGATEFSGDDIEWFALRDTIDNLYYAKKRLLTPGDYLGRKKLGEWCQSHGALELAASVFQEACQLAPEQAEPRLALADVFRQGFRWEDELNVCLAALSDNVQSGAILTRAGEIYEIFDLPSKAEESYRQVLSSYPDHLEAQLRLGGLLSQSGRDDEAVTILQQADKLAAGGSNAERAQTLLQLAQAFMARGRFSEADREISRALSVVPGHPEATRMLAMVRYLSGESGAAHELLKGLSYSPYAGGRADEGHSHSQFASLFNRGLAAMGARAFPEARENFEAAASLDPVQAGLARAALGYLALIGGNWDVSFEQIQTALEVAPNEAYHQYLLGKFHSARGNHGEARDAFRETLQVAPKFSWAMAELSRSAYFLEEYEEGSRYARAALQVLPTSAELHVLAGLHALRLGEVADARDHVSQALGLDEDDPAALNLNAVVLYQTGGGEGILRSLDYFQRAITSATKRNDLTSLDYANQHRTAIEDNRSKVQWRDDFNRKQIKRGWEAQERFGIRVAARENKVQFQGTQNQEEKLTTLLREFSHRTLVSYQITVDMKPLEKASFGVLLARFQREDIRDGIFFGKDGEGRLAYTILKSRTPQDPVVLSDVSWPTEGVVTLGIELKSLKEGSYRLLMDGEVVQEIQVPSLKNAGMVKMGVYGRSGIGSRWEGSVDDALIVMRKG